MQPPHAATVFRWSFRIGLSASEIGGAFAGPAIAAIAPAAVLAWLANQSHDPRATPYVLIGASLMSVWTYAVLRLGFMLFVDVATGRTDLLLTADTSLWLINLGLASAILVWSLPGAVVGAAVVVLVMQSVPHVFSIPVLLVGSIACLLSVLSLGSLLSPIRVLAGGREGVFNVLIPLGVVLGGVIYPLAALPSGVAAVGYALPLSWATRAATSAFQSEGSGAGWRYAMISVALSAVYLIAARLLYTRVEERIRETGLAF